MCAFPKKQEGKHLQIAKKNVFEEESNVYTTIKTNKNIVNFTNVLRLKLHTDYDPPPVK